MEHHSTMNKTAMNSPPSLNAHSRLLRETWKTARRLKRTVIHYPESWEPFKEVSIPPSVNNERTSDLETEISQDVTSSDCSNGPTRKKSKATLPLINPSPPLPTVIKFHLSLRSSSRLRGQWVLLLAFYDPRCADTWVLGDSEYFDKWAQNWRTDNMTINSNTLNTDIWTEVAMMRLFDFRGEEPMIYEEIDYRTKLTMLIGDVLTTPEIRVYTYQHRPPDSSNVPSDILGGPTQMMVPYSAEGIMTVTP